jgi:hypothetical protein
MAPSLERAEETERSRDVDGTGFDGAISGGWRVFARRSSLPA